MSCAIAAVGRPGSPAVENRFDAVDHQPQQEDQVRALVRRTTRETGVPELVEDAATLALVVRLIADRPQIRHSIDSRSATGTRRRSA